MSCALVAVSVCVHLIVYHVVRIPQFSTCNIVSSEPRLGLKLGGYLEKTPDFERRKGLLVFAVAQH